ncbi:MAG: hypothetical protein KC431_07790 [Myxococcales bacterium]|nr:hypothetical protein [Myxococcales bacterium]
MLALGILLAATTAAPSCPSLPADLAELLPTTVTTAVALDVDAFTKTAVGKAVLPALHGDLQLSEALEILGDCGITLERTYSLLAARDDEDGRLVLVQGHQLGEDATLACLGHELRARNDGVDPWTRSQGAACIDRLEFVDGSRAWVANDYTLIWARGDDFAASIEGTLTGARAHVVPPRLEPVLRRTDRKAQVWVAALLDLDDRRTLPGSWPRDATSLGASIDFSSGLAASLTFGAPDVATRVSLRERVIADVLTLGARLDEYGVEHELRERARVGIIDDHVALELELDAGELLQIREHIGERITGRGVF